MAQDAVALNPNIRSTVQGNRFAIDPVTDRALLNDYLRKLITPNIDESRTIYTGIVMKILESSDSSFKTKDIFYDLISNQERLTDITHNNPNKKILFVHIPFFTTSGKIDPTSFLNYDTFNKVRVVYEGKEPIQVGNAVQISFADKVNFLHPKIIDVVSTDVRFDQIASKIGLETFAETSNPYLSIDPPKIKGNSKQQEVTRPGGGYQIAFSQLDNINDPKFLLSFISTLDKDVYGDLSKIIINIEKVSSSTEVLSYSVDSKIPQNLETNPARKDYLIYAKINFDCEKKDKISSLISNYLNYVYQNFDSSLGFTFKKEDSEKDVFYLDVNLNNLINSSEKNLSVYLQVQKDFIEYKNYIKNNKSKNVVPETIKANI